MQTYTRKGKKKLLKRKKRKKRKKECKIFFSLNSFMEEMQNILQQ